MIYPLETHPRSSGCISSGLYHTFLTVGILLATMPVQAANNHFVEIYNSGYSPATLNITAGDTVMWVNQEDENHTVTSSTGAWPSQTLGWSASFSHTFTTGGTYNYYCQFGGLTGVINVAAPGNTPPTVAITSPTNNATFAAPATFMIVASASDPGGSVASVAFFIGSTLLGTDTTSPYSVAASSIPAGTYTLYAIATDNAGAKTTNSSTVIVNGPPTVSITSPTNNTVFSGAPASFTIAANASDAGGSIASVQFRIGSTILTTDTTSPYTATANNIAAGTHTLYAIATDNGGAKATNSVSIIVNSPPTVSITSPTNTSVFRAPCTTTAHATAADTDGSVTNVVFLLNGSTIAQDATAPYSATMSGLAPGSYQLTVQAFDNRGGSAVQNSTFQVVTNSTISGVKRVAGQFQFTAATIPSQVYVFEGTTNFVNWTPLSTNTAVGSSITFTDTQAGLGNRFYRVRSQ